VRVGGVGKGNAVRHIREGRGDRGEVVVVVGGVGVSSQTL
jgi:hypothetical protein